MKWVPLIAMICAIAWTVKLVFAAQLYDFSLWLYRKSGWMELADRWEKRKTWWLPLARLLLGMFIIAAVIVLYLCKK